MRINEKRMRQIATVEGGATSVEYALMVALIALVIVAAVAAIGPALSDRFAEAAAGIRNSGGGGN